MEFLLDKWDKKYIDDVAFYANNEKIACNLRNAFPNPYTREDARGYVLSCAADSEERQLCRAIVVDGHAVGSIGISWGQMSMKRVRSLDTGWRRSSGEKGS